MDTLSTSKVANLLDQLLYEAAEQMPSARAAIKQIRSEHMSPAEWPSDWTERMIGFHFSAKIRIKSIFATFIKK